MAKRRHRRTALKSDPVEIAIESMSNEGRGVSHINGKVVFVEGALPKEIVKAAYQTNRSQYAELRTTEVITQSPDRVEPPCTYAGACGGCTLQHLNNDSQLTFKEGVLLEQLEHVAGLQAKDFVVLPKLRAKVLGYRRKARLAVRHVVKKGGVLVGFREKNSGFIMDMQSCQVLHHEVSALINPLRLMLTSLDASSDIPQIEVAVGDSEADGAEGEFIALVFRHLNDLSDKDLEVILDFGLTNAVQIYLQPEGVDSVKKIFPKDGVPRLYYSLPGHSLNIGFHPLDFTQINGEMNVMIIDRVIEILDLQKNDSVLDLFCGLGNFALPIAKKVRRVTGIEASAEMVKRARENALNNNISNAEFNVEDLYKAPLSGSWATDHYTKVMLDPPRTGASEVIPLLTRLKPEKIVYVSCNPVTLARDANILVSNGFKLKSAGVMDMFPHTSHVESIAEFAPK